MGEFRDGREELVLHRPGRADVLRGGALRTEVPDVVEEFPQTPRFGPETDGPEVDVVSGAEVGLHCSPAGTGEEFEEADYSGAVIP